MAEVRLEAIARRYNNITAIEDITFTVPDGELWVLVGPSGCGKSTILRAIAGLDRVTEGDLYIGNQRMNDIPARQRDVAMVFQNYALYPHMTVAENISFGLRMRGEKPDAIARQVESVARSLAIEHLLTRKPKQLSGGQQQRVALGRAIARQPKVFLLDEPLSNLDAQLRDDTRAELKQLHARLGITTLYVTHDQTEAMTLADRIVVLQHGRIQQIGSPQDIYARPANRQVATFLGSPPMNILPAVYSSGKFYCDRQPFPCSEVLRQHLQPSEGQHFELGIRPESVRLAAEEGLEVCIEVVEPLGRETLVRARLPESESAIDFLAASDWEGHRGDRVRLAIAADNLFIFEPSSGKTLYPQS
ncbi:ABC transporter ATP-binding protein [Oscillatoria sp. FACHB-1406]|uniref:ABC transporter ATP-binding protein n=1 Tax=Oscillatoria sp. FACHB-1406 TaxID=2692846 RepID=UPI0016885B78|nr:ABC transporter ATP-binding protein [Oscillatoria sp. FACHB-1406]MBD2580334.1 ABC transporter ATP-binding protein [Oscillatoria sp. FACHB-1406]